MIRRQPEPDRHQAGGETVTYRISLIDLAQVVYSAGKVFDGLSTSRTGTESFLRAGSLEGVTSRSDLALLEDLRDVAQYVVDHAGELVDSRYVCEINAVMTRSGALHPGELRRQVQGIGVPTRYGRHEQAALTGAELRHIIGTATHDREPVDAALGLFVDLARAQPFEDGNKRTALFAANGLLVAAGAGVLLSIPVDEQDPTLADSFNDLLARAYMRREDAGVKDLLRLRGVLVQHAVRQGN